MSEQPNNLQEAPECPTDDEVLAKRDAEIERLRKERDDLEATAIQAATLAQRLRGTLEYIAAQAISPAYRNNPNLALNVIRANAKSALDDQFQAAVSAALAQSSLDKPSRVGDGIAAVPETDDERVERVARDMLLVAHASGAKGDDLFRDLARTAIKAICE